MQRKFGKEDLSMAACLKIGMHNVFELVFVWMIIYVVQMQ